MAFVVPKPKAQAVTSDVPKRCNLQLTKMGRTPRQRSFSAALQAIAASWLVIVLSRDPVAARLVEVELANLAEHLVGNRPGRVEPRAVKRCPKEHALLTKPRDQARAELFRVASS